jgi:hypothetical protein
LPTGDFMTYNRDEKKLMISEKPYTIFSSKRKAHTAIWHTVQQSGVPGSHVDYEVVPVED